ncbi:MULTISPECIES: hypothetical protein [unclassified Pseudomonas]|uniref:hypothetical protein n=1 Tax=unclassified Pseudomonas TaxID=196821 RepID=UPI000A1F4401|nr:MULTISPECIES: hypothetical protein [unclassified Pseudomonas]
MTTSTPPDNTVLVLYPPIVNGHTTPVEGAHIGVPLVAYDLVTDGEGAVVLVDPPPTGTMNPGDIMELWLEGEPAALDSETIVDPNARTTLRIPKGRLHPDRVNKLYYTIRRGSSNLGTSTPPLEILYNRIRPGLKDRLTDPGGHSELKLLLPDEIKNGVGPDFVSAEVCVAYPYCRAYDLITLKCNGELLEPKPRVNRNQAPQPPNPGDEIPITICFTITRAFLDKAKRQDKKLHFSHTVTDQLGNGPDTDAPWSPVQSVDEDLDGVLLPMPILLERKEDYPGDDASIIDLEKLAGNPLLLVVITKDNRFVVGDEIVATYTTTGQSDPVVVRGKVEEDPFTGKLPCFLEVPNDKVFAGSKVTANYELHRPTVGLVGISNMATATVTGTAPVNLKPPTLVAPATNPIDVLAYENGVTVRVEHLSALPGDQARLLEVNPLPGAEPFPLLTLNQNKRANFKLAPAFLVARRGTAIKLRWELIRGGEPEGESTDLTLTIRSIAEDDPRLPTPNIAGNTSSELKVQELTTDARILAGKWPLFVPGQPIWVTCSGFDKNGDPVNKDVRSGEPNDSPDGLSVLAPVEWLKTLKDGSELTIACAVNLDGSAIEAKPVSFPQRSYIIKSSISIYENFDSAPKQNIYENEPLTLDTGLTINVLKNATGIHYNAILTDPSPPRLQTMQITAGSIVKFSWEGLATTIKLEVRQSIRPSTIIFLDPSGNTIETRQLPYRYSYDLIPVDFEYKAPAGQYISHFQINAAPTNTGIVEPRWFYLDDLTIN